MQPQAKTGFRVTFVRLDEGKAISCEPFASGWESKNTNRGRPVEVQAVSDGSLPGCEDFASAAYRISYSGR